MKRTLVATTAALGLTSGLILAAPAVAGHLNPLLEAQLSGRQEVGPTKKPVGDPNGRGEAYVFGIDGDPTTLCYILKVSKIAELDQAPGGPRMAHLHRAPAGQNGPVEVTLAWPQDGQAADCLTEGEAGKGLDPGEVQQILANPESYYVNVHNSVYPGGAIRGQLSHDH